MQAGIWCAGFDRQMRVPQVAGRELVGDQNRLPNMPYVF